jgi:hypothetical protein
MANETPAPPAASFQGAFAALQPLILGEWPEVDAEALAATGGDLERVVALLAERTRHTRTLLNAQLAEILQVATAPPRQRDRGAGGSADPTDRIIAQLEERAAELLRELRGGLVERARGKARESPLLTLLMAVGLGFILGVLCLRPGLSRKD